MRTIVEGRVWWLPWDEEAEEVVVAERDWLG